MAVSKYAVAGGLVVLVTVAGTVTYCHRDFADAAAAGDFDRAERRAGLLAINDVAPAIWIACGLMVIVLGFALVSLMHQ
jgi:hypothetical protein